MVPPTAPVLLSGLLTRSSALGSTRDHEGLPMIQNERSLDRVARVLIGSVLLTLVVAGPHSWLGLLGIVPLLTGLVGFCPLYRLLGVSTRTAKT